MKILLLSQGRTIADQPDFDAAFRAAKALDGDVILRNIPYVGYIAKYGEVAFYQEVLRQNEEFKPDLVFFQFYHSGGDAGIAQCCSTLKASSNCPLIFGSIGDPFYTGYRKYLARPLPKSIIDLARNADAIFSTSMGNVADEIIRLGGKNILFLPHAFCPEHFPDWDTMPISEPQYDVVMLCSKGRLIGRKPVVTIQNNWRRHLVVNMLSRRFGSRFAVFGRGWKMSSARGLVPFKEQLAYFAKSRIAVDAPAPIYNTDYYASDRPFFILGSGVPLVYFYTPRFEKVFRDGEHAYFVRRLWDVESACEKALELSDNERRSRAEQMRQFVKERHMLSHRVDTIISTFEALLKHRHGEISKDAALRAIRMWHFLPEVDLEEEYQHCVANWVG